MVRPTKYTPDVAERILQAIELGATYELACRYGGISDETFTRWRKRYVGFAENVKKAEGKGAVKWLARIEAGAADHWQAAAWKLERRYPHDYGRTITDHNVTVKHDDLINEIAEKYGIDPLALAAEIKSKE